METSGSKTPRVALVCPPVSKPSEPGPSVLALAGHLAARGVDARVFDANLMVHEELSRGRPLGNSGSPQSGSAATSARRAEKRGDRTFRALTLPETWRDSAKYRAALNNLAEAHRVASLATGCRIGVSDFVHPALSPLCSADLALVAEDPSLLPTKSALEMAAAKISDFDPSVVGISVTYLSEALNSWALAGILRNRGYGGLLLLGGALVSSWASKLTPASPALKAWDAAVVGPGESVLEEVLRSGRIPNLPGVLSPSRSIWNPAAPTSGAISFLPDSSSLDWSRYAAPGGILPVAASRGCYWSRCAFCPEAGGGYAAADAKILAKAILDQRDRGGPSNVHFTDNALTPRHLTAFADAFRGSGVSWYGFARLEKGLNKPGTMEKLAAGGLKMLQLGIETASPRLLKRMGKGTTPQLADETISRAHDAGIRVYGYFLFGMPTETEEEAETTVEWIQKRADRLTFLNLSIMNLPSEGEIGRAPDRFGLDMVKSMDEENDLSLYLAYSGSDTIGREKIRKLLARARKDQAIRAALLRSPKGFTSNHAAFAPL